VAHIALSGSHIRTLTPDCTSERLLNALRCNILGKIEEFIGNSRFSIPAYSSTSRQQCRLVLGVLPDLFGEDVCVACVACDLADHAQVDETQAHCADEGVVGSVVECVGGGDFV
jgi:hypothetical protein